MAKPTLNSADEQSTEQTLALIKHGQYLVQLASVRKLTLVKPGWKRFQSSHEELLSNLALHTEEADIAGKTFYRIQTGPFASKAEAINFCGKLKARDQDCFVTKKAK